MRSPQTVDGIGHWALQSWETQVCIKFCPDEPPEQKSPLDDIRQSEEYKKLLENN